MAVNALCMCAVVVAVVAVQVTRTTETSAHSKDGTASHEHPRCLSTPHSHVIDQFFGLEVALVVVLSVEPGPGQPGDL